MLVKQIVLLSGFTYGQEGKQVDTFTERENTERRYSQLMDMMNNFNPDFDERKYWTYGCNCLILGDRPMSDPGLGAPVDALDRVCKAYKDCLKCARREHDETCIGEFVRYKFVARRGNIICKDKPGACGRDLCECDAMFAREHVRVKDVFTDQYHAFWGNWDAEDKCTRSAKGSSEPECCGGRTKAFSMINAKRKECCPDGSTAAIGMC